MATKHEFQVEMTCDGCSGAVQRVLGKRPEVTNVDIDMEKQRVYVTSSLPADELLEIIKKTGKATTYYPYLGMMNYGHPPPDLYEGQGYLPFDSL